MRSVHASSTAPEDGQAQLKHVTDDRLEELRELLLGDERRRIDSLARRLDDPAEWLEMVARSLPEAVALRATQDDRLAHAVQPTVDKSVRTSVRRNPKLLADAIFPALGPAIRRAVATTLKGMVESLNQMLNRVISVRGLMWRIQAWRTGRPFAEVVLLNTLVYRVEEVVLIHRETGIVIRQVVHPDVATALPDSDLVSAMLSAIQSFVEDAFSAKGEAVDTVQMGGDHALWIEQGSRLVLATLIRGAPPITLRSHLQDVLDDIEVANAASLEAFDGEVEVFELLQAELEACLVAEEHDDKRMSRRSPLLRPLAALAATAVLVAGVRAWSAHHRWSTFLEELFEEPGVVVTSSSASLGRYRVTGLRDPLSAEPSDMLAAVGMDPGNVSFAWEPFQSSEPSLVLARVRRLLAPPASVQLTLRDGTLVVTGSAPEEWLSLLPARATAIPGIAALDLSGVVRPRERLNSAIRDLEGRVLYARWASAELIPGQEDQMDAVAEGIHRLRVAQAELGKTAQIALLGHADASGPEQYNERLSQDRADLVYRALLDRGVAAVGLLAVGLGVSPTASVGSAQDARSPDRSVTIRVLGPPGIPERTP